MKKEWEEPRILVQKFEPNEYIAACGDTEYGVFKFECNAGESGVHYAIKDANGKAYQYGKRRLDGRGNNYFYKCGTTHESPTGGEYINGYHLDDPSTPTDENIAVVIWIEDYNTGLHCTTNSRDSWEITKS